MKQNRPLFFIIFALLLCVALFSSCAAQPERTALKVIIIPKFEVGEISGDFPGEAQLFYEHYCAGCQEIEIPHMPPHRAFLRG